MTLKYIPQILGGTHREVGMKIEGVKNDNGPEKAGHNLE